MFKATAAALLALALIGPTGVSAGTPGWKFYITPIPADGIVAPNASAGFVIKIANEGRSNISALFLDTDPNALPPSPVSPTYVGPISYTNQVGAGFCHAAGDGPLFCDFGNLVAGASVTVTVAFQMPASGSTFFNLRALGNGNTPSDGGTSHGDALKALISINGGNSHPPVTPAASITLNASKNFAGGFSPDDDTVVANDPNLGPKNIQSGQIASPAGGIAVTLEDGLADTAFSCTTVGITCTHRFGEWARLNVANGTKFEATGIHVTIIVLGNKVPSGATVDTIVLIHVPTNPDGTLGTPYVISNRCDNNPGGGLDPDGPDSDLLGDECILVTQDGKNIRVDAWFLSNGGARTGY